MIPSKRESLKVEGNLDGRVIPMTIDQDSLYNIMDVLANLYDDAVYAVVREYSTNALDSHIAAGVKDPIKITLPTPLSPFLYIQDFGLGLNEDDIEAIYSRYGKSTKLGTNDQTGSLGLGSKSALAYTAQFTLVGIKDGVSTTVAVGRDEEGIGTQTVVDTSPTNDHNGVTIMIPVKDGDSSHFELACCKLFKYWPKGTVLVNGEEPVRISDNGLRVNDDIILLEGTGHYESWSKSYVGTAPHTIVMGAVPYPVKPDKFDFDFSGRYQVVARVPMGSLHFTPSRDGLNYTKKTMAKLEEVKATIKDTLLKSINTEIDAAKSRPEALKVAIKWRQALPKAFKDEPFAYRGLQMPDSIVAAINGTFIVSKGNTDSRPGSYSNMRAIDLVAVPEAMWIYNFRRSFTPTVKKKLRYYCKNILGYEYPEQFICCGDRPTSPWIEDKNILDWDPIELIKLPRIVSGRTVTGRVPLSYDVLTCRDNKRNWDREVLLEDIPQGIPTFTTTGGDYSVAESAKQIAHVLDDFQLVQMTSNRTDKFHRLRPDSCSWMNALKDSYQTWYSTLTEFEKEALGYHAMGSSDWQMTLNALPVVGIDDPGIKRLRYIENIDPAHLSHLSGILQVFKRASGMRYDDFVVDNPLKRYPLISTDVDSNYDYTNRRWIVKHKHKRHNKIYVNAVFNQEQGT